MALTPSLIDNFEFLGNSRGVSFFQKYMSKIIFEVLNFSREIFFFNFTFLISWSSILIKEVEC